MKNGGYGISNNTLGAIIALEAIILGIFVGLKMGFSFEPPSTLSYIATLGGNRHVVGTIAALILIPTCAKQTKNGFLIALIVLSITATLTLISVIDLLFITHGFEYKAPVAAAMLIFQIIAIVFINRSRREIDKGRG